MRLFIIIVQREDSKKLEKVLIEEKYHLTRLESVGGYLKKKNSTFLVGVEEEKSNHILNLIKKTCQSKKEVIATPTLSTPGLGETIITNGTTKIKIGGATVFIMKIEKFVKL